jgi:hypothetical protein
VKAIAALALCLAVAPAASAQDGGDPPCAAGVAPSATIRAKDLEDAGGPLTATHTITLDLETADGLFPDFTVALPPGARVLHGSASPRFQVDAPGSVPITATWSHFDPGSGSYCNASASTTLSIGAAKPLRYIAPRRHRLLTSLDWRVRYGKDSDLRPVELRVRGVRRARLPGASASRRKLTFALRDGDKGLTLAGTAERVLRSAGWTFHATFFGRNQLGVSMMNLPRGRSFGFELELVQAGRRLGRTRAVGRCSQLICRYRLVR